MGGIASVAVDPYARGAGIASALLSEALRTMRDAGQPISALYPPRPRSTAAGAGSRSACTSASTLGFGPLARAAHAVAAPAAGGARRRATWPACTSGTQRLAADVDGLLDRRPARARARRRSGLRRSSTWSTRRPDGLLGYLTATRTLEHRAHGARPGRRRPRTPRSTLLRTCRLGRQHRGDLAAADRPGRGRTCCSDLPVEHRRARTTRGCCGSSTCRPRSPRGAGPPRAHLGRPAVDIEVVDEHAPWHAGRHRLIVDRRGVRLRTRRAAAPSGSPPGRSAPGTPGSADTAMLRRAGLLDGDADRGRRAGRPCSPSAGMVSSRAWPTSV